MKTIESAFKRMVNGSGSVVIQNEYEELDFTKEETESWVNALHNSIDISIIFYRQRGTEASDTEYLKQKEGFVNSYVDVFWPLDENYDFEDDLHSKIMGGDYRYFKE